MASKLFFTSSRQAACNITDIFDFVWPTAVAMWNLRWQVNGFLGVRPSVLEETLVSRFVSGSGIRGANLRLACIETSWQDQQERFAKFLLIEICALYEAWLEGVSAELGVANFRVIDFQFPSCHPGGGLGAALARTRSAISTEIANCIFPALARNRKYSGTKIEELLKCYWFFKECRNSLVHRGALVDQKLLNAYGSFNPLTRNDLGLAEKPAYSPINALGDKVAPQLRGVVGLADVVLRIITTLDAELSKCQEAENVLNSMWYEKHGGAVTLPYDLTSRNQRVIRLVVQLNLPKPSHPDELMTMLKRLGLIN
jgi:hypothetical protein